MGKFDLAINVSKNAFMKMGGQNPLFSKRLAGINISELGYRLPNGNINFQTEEAAIKYIKNRLLDSLNREQQFERCITKKGTRILSEANGSRTHCVPPFSSKEFLERTSDKAIRDVEVWHSHPDMYGAGNAAPLSPPEGGDLATFDTLHLKKIVAMNSKGEINSMEALNDYSPSKFKEFKSKFGDFMETEIHKLLPENIQKRKTEIEKFFSENNYKNIPKDLLNKLEKEYENIIQLSIEAQTLGKGAEFLHKYYTTANNYGMRYYTNFSNLA